MRKCLTVFASHTGKLTVAAALAATLLSAADCACAGIVVDGTRVVYPASRREVTIQIRNPSDRPSLVQAWLDAGGAKARPGESKVPFVMTPPLFRLDPTKAQSLRLVYTHEPLPEDRESVFWLNVLDIPPRVAPNPQSPNQLEVAFKHRMKVFFRPASLKGSAADAPARLTWKLLSRDGKLVGLQASNPTAYHVSLIEIIATVAGRPVALKADMVDPFASRSFDVPAQIAAPSSPVAVKYSFVNDYGGNISGVATASSTQ
jgi:chaperone protein EcpD